MTLTLQKKRVLISGATYTIKADSVIIGGKDAVINVKTAEGKPAADVSVYLEENDELVGKTDETGHLQQTDSARLPESIRSMPRMQKMDYPLSTN